MQPWSHSRGPAPLFCSHVVRMGTREVNESGTVGVSTVYASRSEHRRPDHVRFGWLKNGVVGRTSAPM
jgi:hypothetical protein